MNYQPKGSMCENCTKKNDDCSKLDFKSMRNLTHYLSGHCTVYIVKCTEFKRETTR